MNYGFIYIDIRVRKLTLFKLFSLVLVGREIFHQSFKLGQLAKTMYVCKKDVGGRIRISHMI